MKTKKKKILKSITVLPQEILIRIFTYLPVKQIASTISFISKEFQTIVSCKEFMFQLLKQNGIFQPILKKETTATFYASIPSFYHFIFYPMKLIEKYTLKLKQILPKRFTSNSLKIETLEKNLKEKLKLNIEFPPCYQMFFLLCTSWGGMFEGDFFIQGSGLFSKKEFLSETCNWKQREFEEKFKIPIQYIDLATLGISRFGSRYFLCLDSNQNFGRIAGIYNGEGYVGFSKKSFHQIIKELSEFIEKNHRGIRQDQFENKVDWYEFIATLKFEYTDFPRTLHEEEEEEYEEGNEEIDSEESESNSDEFE
jgi:hypothetical protein